MKKRLTVPPAISAWIKAHTTFLKLLIIFIGLGIIAGCGVDLYGSITQFRASQQFYRRQAESSALGSLNKTLDHFVANPEAMVEFLLDGVNIPGNISIMMKKVQDADTPHETWHLIGWSEASNGEIFRQERCFAVPKTSDYPSN